MVNITVQDVKDHLGYDLTDEMVERKIKRLMDVADAYLTGAIGKDFPTDDPRIKELALVVVADMYENRSLVSGKVSNQTRQLVNDFCLQLRLELARASEGVD